MSVFVDSMNLNEKWFRYAQHRSTMACCVSFYICVHSCQNGGSDQHNIFAFIIVHTKLLHFVTHNSYVWKMKYMYALLFSKYSHIKMYIFLIWNILRMEMSVRPQIQFGNIFISKIGNCRSSSKQNDEKLTENFSILFPFENSISFLTLTQYSFCLGLWMELFSFSFAPFE